MFSEDNQASAGTVYAGDFFEGIIREYPGSICSICEIGCNYGYNLNYLYKRLYNITNTIEVFGIDPSDKAIEHGKNKWRTNGHIHLDKACSNELPFSDNQFDVVIVGFCLYITPREWIDESISEINRVLRRGGGWLLQILIHL